MQNTRPKLPKHLSLNESQGLIAGEPIAQFEIGDFKNFVYLVLDWDNREAAIVDPQSDISTPLHCLEENGFRLGKIILTHTHWDHVAGVPALLDQLPQLQIYVHPLVDTRLKLSKKHPEQIHSIQDQEKIPVGNLSLEVLHTPGHSAGECCYFLNSAQPPYLLSGDTLLIRDCGRTDLESGSTSEMFSSLQRIKRLPPETVILPGHHYTRECASTLAEEILRSPPLACSSVSELEKLP